MKAQHAQLPGKWRADQVNRLEHTPKSDWEKSFTYLVRAVSDIWNSHINWTNSRSCAVGVLDYDWIQSITKFDELLLHLDYSQYSEPYDFCA